MCGSRQPAPQPKAPDNNYWSWWNFQDSKENLGGSYRLNELAIGDVLQTSKGTSNLKNIATGNTRDTTGTSKAPLSVTKDRDSSRLESSLKTISSNNRGSTNNSPNRLNGTLTTIPNKRRD